MLSGYREPGRLTVVAIYLFGNLLPIHAELKPLELDHEHIWGLVDGYSFGSSDQATLARALVLVLPLQILCGCETLESLLQGAGSVDLQADVQKGVDCVALKATLNALHLRQDKEVRFTIVS